MTKTFPSKKILVIGYARHGKDTVCEILNRNYGLSFQSSSFTCAEHVMMPYFARRGKIYYTVEECYEDRVNHRKEWYEQIRAFNEGDLTRLARLILEDSDVYCGMRNIEEFLACVKEGLFDEIVWVDRSKHLPPESEESCSLNDTMATYVIDNNGDMDDLQEEINLFYERRLS